MKQSKVMRAKLILVLIVGLINNSFGVSNYYLDVKSESGVYVAGEVVNFLIYKRNSTNHQVYEKPIFITIDLVAASGEVVCRENGIITENDNRLQLKISEDIESGHYRAVVYGGGARPSQLEFDVYGKGFTIPKQKSSVLRFDFGLSTGVNHFLADAKNTVTLEVKDQKANIVTSFTGKVIDQNDSIVADLKADSIGVYRFTFTPMLNKAYYIRYVNNNEVRKEALPVVSDKVAIINIIDRDRVNEIEIRVGGSAGLEELVLKEIVDDSLASTSNIDSYNKSIYLPKLDAQQVQYVIENAQGEIIGKRVMGSVSRNSFSANTKRVYEKREKVSLKLEGVPDDVANVFVKVFNKQLAGEPVSGNTLDEITEQEQTFNMKVDLISNEAYSRVSLFYIDQGRVDEFYLNEFSPDIVKDFIGKSKVWSYQFDSKGKKLGRVNLSFDYDTIDYPMLKKALSNNIHTIEEVRQQVKVQKAFDNYQETSLRRDFSDPDYVVELANYEKLPSVEEVLKALIPKCRVVRRKGERELRLVPKEASFRYDDSPLIMINGVPTFESNDAFALNVGDIEKVAIYNSLFSQGNYGTFGKNGVVSFILKKGAENPLSDFYDSLPLMYGQSPEMNVWGENGHTSDSQRRPDLRTVLFWQTQKLSNKNQIEFYTSDVLGSYEVYIEYLTSSGRKVHYKSEFEVR